MTVSAAMIDLLGRASLDLLTMLLLVGWLYKSQQSVPSMPLVLCSLNVGIFAAVTVFSYGSSTPLRRNRFRPVRLAVDAEAA